MIKKIFIGVVLLYHTISYCQILPQDRIVDWSHAGLEHPLIQPDYIINFVDKGGVSNGTVPNDSIFSQIINSLIDDTAEIYFPNGSYLFNQPLNLKENLFLRGESGDSATLIFNLINNDHLIKIEGSLSSDTIQIINNLLKDSSIVQINNVSGIQQGDNLLIFEDDSMLVTSLWAMHSTGQINKVKKITGNSLIFHSPFRRNFFLSRNVRAIKLNMIKNVGIESLKIRRLDTTVFQTSNIHFKYASNCKVKCIESINCNFSHIDVRKSSNIEISGSYFHKAFDYGNGGKAYGIMLHHNTGECLITRNIFDHLRHSMIVQAGANGNVFSYNYSTNPYWTDVSLPANSAGDLVLHGNYPYANLFEGNTVQNIVIDDSHGINGKYNTFFRNRAELYGIVMNFAPPSDFQNFVGNEITNPGFLLGNYLLFGTDHFEFGNNKNGTIIPSGTNELDEASLYSDSIPAYYFENSSWPPIGVPNPMNTHIIEAEEMYFNGSFTKCRKKITTIIDSINISPAELIVFPNPTIGNVQIILSQDKDIHIDEISLFTTEGIQILRASGSSHLNVEHINIGFYILKIKLSNDQIIIKKVLKT